MQKLTLNVNPKAEFLEIANDFGNPLELFREAISNSFDANSKNINITVEIDESSGSKELYILIEDDGDGISEVNLNNFFGLGFSTRNEKDSLGKKIKASIGEKGHGTKIFFNSANIKLISIHNNKKIIATVDQPIQKLRSNNQEMPIVEYIINETNEKNSTKIEIRGYNENSQSGFSHNEIKDYIYWFTKFGSCEKEIGLNQYSDVKIYLKGLGCANKKLLEFGHPFPLENYLINELKKRDKINPLDYFVAKWIFPDIQVSEHPSYTIDIVFYLEGDLIKRKYNKMIHKRFAPWSGGVYNVEQRYGLWLCKDFIPIERHNEWVSEKSEWTKYHAFVNCQAINLTANRGDAGNTNRKLLKNIGDTVKNVFQSKIEKDRKFIKYQEEFIKVKQYKSAKKEEEDFNRRKKLALQKKASKFRDFLIFEPRQEGGVFSIVTQLLTLDSNVFNFKVIDYDTSIGYDLLVTDNNAIDLNNSAMYFVEMKFILKTEFNHSFKKLHSIICWDTNLSNEYEISDMTGAKRIMRITPASKNEDGYTKFMLISNTASHNIEVFVLRKYLAEKFNLNFVPRAELE